MSVASQPSAKGSAPQLDDMPAPTTLVSPSPALVGSPVPPAQRIYFYSPDEWEIFITEWATGLAVSYRQIKRIGGTGDMIRDGVDGFLVPQGDVAAIVDRLRRLQSDPEFAGAMGQAARQSALVSFDHQTNARLLLSRIAEAQK